MVIKYSDVFPTSTIPIDDVNIIAINIRSLRGKISDLSIYLKSLPYPVQVLLCNETWLTPDDVKYFNIPGYESFHSTRQKTGGGVAIYVLNSFANANQIHCSEANNCNFLAVDLSPQNIIFATAYRPPSSPLTTYLENVELLLNQNKDVFFYTDSNIDVFKNSNDKFKLYETFSNNGLDILNSLSPSMFTRKNRSQGSLTCIDQIFSNLFKASDVLFCLDDIQAMSSDHRAIFVSYSKPKCHKLSYQKKILMSIINHQAIHDKKLFADVRNDNCNSLIADTQKVLADNTTEKIIKNKFHKHFMNSSILNSMKLRDNYYKLTKKFPNILEYSQSYKKIRNSTNLMVKKAQKAFSEKHLGNNTNIRKTWKFVNSALKNTDPTSTPAISPIKVNGKLTINRFTMAEAFNTYFTNVPNEIHKTIKIDPLTTYTHLLAERYEIAETLFPTKCTVMEVVTFIASLSNSGAKDIYGMSNNLIKKHAVHLSPPLTILFNTLLEQGSFPTELKFATVKPIFKSGDKSLTSNYRPISILPIFSKLYEKLILARLNEHIDRNKIIHPNQFGFIAKSNTEAAAVNLMRNIYLNIENKKLTAVLFVDFRKAFDTISHEILIKKLEKLDLPPLYLNILKNFLHNRSQRVEIDGVHSHYQLVTDGVPQGSILGPKLFNFYINSICKVNFKGSLQLFADDAALVYGESDTTVLKLAIEYDLKLISNWVDAHFMSLNTTKTNYILFHGRKSLEYFTQLSMNILANDKPIERVESARFLGLIIDEKLNFTDHINQIKRTIRPLMFAIKRISHLMNENTAKQLYFAHIYSRLIYLNTIWNAASNKDLDSLFAVQKKSIRIFKSLDNFSSRDLFNPNLLPLPCISELMTLTMVFKIKHGLIKNNFNIIFVKDRHSINTRSKENFFIPNYLTRFGFSDLFCRGFHKFNTLPDKIKNASTLKQFQVLLKPHLLRQFSTQMITAAH